MEPKQWRPLSPPNQPGTAFSRATRGDQPPRLRPLRSDFPFCAAEQNPHRSTPSCSVDHCQQRLILDTRLISPSELLCSPPLQHAGLLGRRQGERFPQGTEYESVSVPQGEVCASRGPARAHLPVCPGDMRFWTVPRSGTTHVLLQHWTDFLTTFVVCKALTENAPFPPLRGTLSCHIWGGGG